MSDIVLQNPRDRLISKITEFKKANLTAHRSKELELFKKIYLAEFEFFAEFHFDLTEGLIKQFDKEELEQLEVLVTNRALRRYRLTMWIWMPLLILLPIAGWIALGVNTDPDSPGGFRSWKYVKSKKKLENFLAKETPLSLLAEKYLPGPPQVTGHGKIF